VAASGVCVNTLSPGGFAGSEQNRSLMTPQVVSALVQQIPARRLGSETDLQAAAVFLASPGAAYVTGHNLIVDGGWTAI
jgi:3-oxoacyl-[acyl-carrier protein] reductase